MTFRDDALAPLAETRTGPLESEELDYGCRFLARYSVELPRASGYRVEFGPPEPRDRPRGGYFQGAEALGPQSISYQELEERGFEWSFEAEPARRPLTLRDSGISPCRLISRVSLGPT